MHYAQAHTIPSMRKGVALAPEKLNSKGVWSVETSGFFSKQKYNEPYYKAEPNKIVIFVSHNG